MNAYLSQPHRASMGHSIRAWWLNGQSDAERDMMGSPGRWDSAVGEPRGTMAGRSDSGAVVLPYTMSSPGQWDTATGAPREMMAGPDRPGAAPVPYTMSSPGSWDPSLGGPLDMMAGRRS